VAAKLNVFSCASAPESRCNTLSMRAPAISLRVGHVVRVRKPVAGMQRTGYAGRKGEDSNDNCHYGRHQELFHGPSLVELEWMSDCSIPV
jgi:hypothetical protein